LICVVNDVKAASTQDIQLTLYR